MPCAPVSYFLKAITQKTFFMKRIFWVLAAAVFSSQLSAQDSSVLKPLDEVVVTAHKYPSKTSTTGKVITVITRQQLERSGGKDLAQLLNEQAGISLNGANSNPGKDKSLYLRGARIDHTLITIDGIPVYDPSGIGGIFDIRNLALENIERIEILRGSQSTLYGSDAIAGVINIITRKAGNKSFQANGLLSAGSNSTFRGNFRAEGSLDRLNYYAGYTQLYSRGINETESSGNTDRDGYRQQNYFAGLGYRVNTALQVQAFYRSTLLTGDIDQGAFTDELDYTYRQKSTQAGFKAQWQTGKWQVNALYQYNAINRIYTDDSVKSRNGFSSFSEGSYKGGEHYAELYAQVPVGSLIRWTVGADLRNSVSDQSYLSVSSFGPFKSLYSNDSLRQNQWGLYTAAQLTLPSGFSVEAGGRLNHHSVYGNNGVYNINPSFLWKKQWKVYANLSSGFRTPSLYQLFSEYGNRNLRPESSVNAEAGLQWYSPSQRYTVRATVFNRTVKNLLFFSFNPTTFQSQYINQDKQKDHGGELEFTATPTKALTVKAFYTYVTGAITTRQNGKDTSYNNLLRRPKHSVGLNIGYQLGSRWFVGTNLQYFSERQDAYFDNTSFQTVRVTLDPYWLLDIYTEYKVHTSLKLFADLRNITDSQFTEVSGFRTLGFNAYAGLRFNF